MVMKLRRYDNISAQKYVIDIYYVNSECEIVSRINAISIHLT